MNGPMKTSLLTSLILLPLGLTPASEPSAHDHAHADKAELSASRKGNPLVEKVRRATARYRDINVALNEKWVAGTGCVSSPNAGAMGIHLVLPDRIGDGELKATEPEALIYEPIAGGGFRLVGVEYIVRAEDWAQTHPNGPPPMLDGHQTNLVPAPNRYGLPAFYEIHVWAWQHNPNGSFADFNTLVSCDKHAPE